MRGGLRLSAAQGEHATACVGVLLCVGVLMRLCVHVCGCTVRDGIYDELIQLNDYPHLNTKVRPAPAERCTSARREVHPQILASKGRHGATAKGATVHHAGA